MSYVYVVGPKALTSCMMTTSSAYSLLETTRVMATTVPAFSFILKWVHLGMFQNMVQTDHFGRPVKQAHMVGAQVPFQISLFCPKLTIILKHAHLPTK